MRHNEKHQSNLSTNDFSSYPEEGFEITDELDGKSFWMLARNRMFGEELRNLTYSLNNPKVLEIGCGNGSFLKHVSNIVDADYTGSEMYLPGVESTQKKVPNVNVIQMDATNIPFREHFDVVAAFDVLEHIEDDKKVIQQVHKCLKPGGAFMIAVPQYPWLWSKLDELVHHRRRYTRSELRHKLEDGGFTVEYVTSHVFFLFPLMIMNRMMSKSTGKTQDIKSFTKFGYVLNFVLNNLMRFDEILIKRRVSLPFGGTIYVIARS